MSTCTDNPRLGRIGCGATFSGGAQHCVARVPWSEHDDGRAHVTFTTLAAAEACWTGDTMRDPATLTTRAGILKLEQSENGRWHWPSSSFSGLRVAPSSPANDPWASPCHNGVNRAEIDEYAVGQQ